MKKMREILFRGKRADDGKWKFGYYDSDLYGAIIRTPNGSWAEINYVDSETVGQFTGKTHKSGVKIFEGDIVEYTNKDATKARYVIEWNGALAAWVAKWTAGEGHMYVTELVCEYMEIIGNIHDNPELLKGDAK